MRFVVLRKADAETEASVMPTEELIVAMGAYNESMVKAGVMLDGHGLQASSKGARVKFSNGLPTVIDGPFAETKELVAGFSVIDVRSKAEAIEWVKRWPQLDGHGEVEIEIRQLFTLDDFGPSEGIERMKEVGYATPRPPLFSHVHSTTICVTDQDRALDFFVNALGWSKGADAMFGPNMRWITVTPPGGTTQIAIGHTTWFNDEHKAPPKNTGITLVSPDIDAAYDTLSKAGVRFKGPVELMPWGSKATWFYDPDDNEFFLVSEQ